MNLVCRGKGGRHSLSVVSGQQRQVMKDVGFSMGFPLVLVS